ncbi:MAG: hypothetical protein M1423_05435 [Acidobacteria bacterium]|nr:hypothetical protein [Acidobacteriota bacterium]
MTEPLDLEAELCSVSNTAHSVTLTFVGTNDEKVSVTLPPIMVETLYQTLGGIRPKLEGRWSPKPG